MTHVSFTPSTEAFRFYSDGTESGSTALATQGSNISVNVDSNAVVLLRIRVQESGGGDGATTDDWQLQVNKNAAGFVNVTGASSNVRGFASTNLTDGGATTNRLTGGSGSFVAGGVAEDGLVDDRQLTASNFTEHLFALELVSADLANNDALTFQVLLNGSSITNNVTPQITATKTPPPGGPIDGTTPLTFSASGTLKGIGNLAGTVGLTFSPSGTVRALPDIVGHGTLAEFGLAEFAPPGYEVASEPPATSDISGTTSLTFTTSATLKGTGTLAGTTGVTFANAGTGEGDGELGGSTSLTFTPSGTLAGAGDLAGSAELAFTPAGSLAGAGTLAGTSALGFTLTGDLAGAGAMAGASALMFTPSGDLAGAGALSGATSLTFSPAGGVKGDGALAGTTTITFAGSARPLLPGAIEGTAGLTFTATGTLVAPDAGEARDRDGGSKGRGWYPSRAQVRRYRELQRRIIEARDREEAERLKREIARELARQEDTEADIAGAVERVAPQTILWTQPVGAIDLLPVIDWTALAAETDAMLRLLAELAGMAQAQAIEAERLAAEAAREAARLADEEDIAILLLMAA